MLVYQRVDILLVTIYKWINPTYPIYNWGELTHLRFVG